MNINLKYIIRSITKRPVLNGIKVIGLSLALASILLMVLFLKFELSFDKFHSNADRIFRFTVTSPDFFEGQHFARTMNVSYVPQLKEQFPEIENYVRLVPVMGNTLKFKNQYVHVNQVFESDSTFFKVFDAEMIVGDKSTLLNAPVNMVVSESFAKRVFGNENPIGQTLVIPPGQYYGRAYEYVVKGIMKDFPKNSHFHPEVIASALEENYKGWAWTYLLFKPGAKPDNIIQNFAEFYTATMGESAGKVHKKAHLQKLSDIHLHSKKLREIEKNSTILVIYSFLFTIGILLLAALINFANLSLGMTNLAQKFFFVGSVSGSGNRIRLKHNMIETLVLFICCVIIAIPFIFIGQYYITQYFGLNLFRNAGYLVIISVLLYGLLTVVTGLTALLRSNQLSTGSKLLKLNMLKVKDEGSRFLIVAQFAVTFIVLIVVLISRQQNQFALKQSMGNDSSNIICLQEVHANVQQKFTIFKNELLKYGSIKHITAMMEPPGGETNDAFLFEMEGYIASDDQQNNMRIGILPCDHSFASLFELNFLSGSNFTARNIDPEGAGEYIINKAAMKKLGYSDPVEIVDRYFKLIWPHETIKIPSGKIIGVVDNFYFSGLKNNVVPLVLFKRDSLWLRNIMISFEPGMKDQGLTALKTVWNTMYPAYPLEYESVDSMYTHVYKAELIQSQLLTLISLISLVINAIGLLGLTLLTTQRRIKEVGIRKVNGATVFDILSMLNIYLVKWILLAFILAVPFAYYAATKWLESYIYKIDVSWWMFGIAFIFTLLLALITVSWQSWRAATCNPIEALRHE